MTPSGGPRFAIGTFSAAGAAAFPGVVVGERVMPLAALHAQLAAHGSVLSLLDNWDKSFGLIAASLPHSPPDGGLALAELTVEAPLAPRQIFCTGANYRQHVADLVAAQGSPAMADKTPEERRAIALQMMDERIRSGRPYAFSKAVTAMTGPYGDIVLPAAVAEPDWELELAIVIGRSAWQVKRDAALDYVAGYTVVNDITARDRIYRADLKSIGTDWLAGKSAPTFLPIGPFLVPAAFVADPMNLHLVLKLNGEVMQDATTADMMFDIARQIEHISAAARLLPGDIVCTGSPAGNGAHYGRYLRPGDLMEGTIEGIGTIRNRCVAEAAG